MVSKGCDAVLLVERVANFKMPRSIGKGANTEKLDIELNVTSLRLPTGYNQQGQKFVAITRPSELGHQ
eukprot:8357010-Pyramimonas_sp.AAC.1